MLLLKPAYTFEKLSFLGVYDKLFPTVAEHPFLIFALPAISQPILMDRRLTQSVSLINQILSQMAAHVYSEHLHFRVAEICVINDSVIDGKPSRQFTRRDLLMHAFLLKTWLVPPAGTSLIYKNILIFCWFNYCLSFVSGAS